MPMTLGHVDKNYGHLTVIGRTVGPDKNGAYWLCKCDCGNEVAISGTALRLGHRTHCGATVHRKLHNWKHGEVDNYAYQVWCGVKARCTNPTNHAWKDYGGRGITICEQWRDSFANFLADMGERPKGLTIDRIDNDKGYEPGNCRWANSTTQARNSRSAKLTPFDAAVIRELRGKIRQADLAKFLGVCKETVARVMREESWS